MEDKLHQYDVIVECNVPAKIKYRLYAKDPEEAMILAEKAKAVSIEYSLPKKRKIKSVVYGAGSSLVKFFKNF